MHYLVKWSLVVVESSVIIATVVPVSMLTILIGLVAKVVKPAPAPPIPDRP